MQLFSVVSTIFKKKNAPQKVEKATSKVAKNYSIFSLLP